MPTNYSLVDAFKALDEIEDSVVTVSSVKESFISEENGEVVKKITFKLNEPFDIDTMNEIDNIAASFECKSYLPEDQIMEVTGYESMLEKCKEEILKELADKVVLNESVSSGINFGDKAWLLNDILKHFNDEEAYYGTGWLYIWPDECSKEDCDYYFGEEESYKELEDSFKRVYKDPELRDAGFYKSPSPQALELAHEFDKELGLEPMEILGESLGESKECFFEIVSKGKDDDEEKIERYDDDFDGARADYLKMTQDDKDNYKYVVLRKVCTDYKDGEEIEVVDSFGLNESLNENKSFSLTDDKEVKEAKEFLENNKAAEPQEVVVNIDADTVDQLAKDNVGSFVFTCTNCGCEVLRTLDQLKEIGYDRQEDGTFKLKDPSDNVEYINCPECHNCETFNGNKRIESADVDAEVKGEVEPANTETNVEAGLDVESGDDVQPKTTEIEETTTIKNESLDESMKTEVTKWWKDVEDANVENKWEFVIDNGDYSDVEAMHAAMFDMLNEIKEKGNSELFSSGKKIYNKYAKYSKYNESLKEGRYADLQAKLNKAKEELKELKVKLENAPTEEVKEEIMDSISWKEVEIGDLEGALAEIRYVDNGNSNDYSGYESLEEDNLETFEDKMNFLAKDEQEAIDGYDKIISLLDPEKDAIVIEQLGKIKTEEIAHKTYLEEVQKDHNLVYTEPLEQEESGSESGDVSISIVDEKLKEGFIKRDPKLGTCCSSDGKNWEQCSEEEFLELKDGGYEEVFDDDESESVKEQYDEFSVTDIEEESLDKHICEHLTNMFENFGSYKTETAILKDVENKIILEGNIKFKDNKEQRTQLVLEAKEFDVNTGKLVFTLSSPDFENMTGSLNTTLKEGLVTSEGFEKIQETEEDTNTDNKVNVENLEEGKDVNKFEVLWYEGPSEEEALKSDPKTKEFKDKEEAMEFYNSIKDEEGKFGFWVTERDGDWEVVDTLVG